MADGPVVDTNLGPAPMGAAGAVGLMSDLAEMRNRQNANVLFQQQMSARHQLGEDLAVWSAQGLSPEEQTKRAQQQPYSVYVTPEISNISGVQKNQVEIAEARERMANSGLGPLAQALNASGGDPKLLDTLLSSVMKSYPPDLQKSLQPAYDGMKASLTDGLPADPAAAKAEQKARVAHIGSTFGVPLDTAYADIGGVKPQVGEAPTAAGAPAKGLFEGTKFTPYPPAQASETATPAPTSSILAAPGKTPSETSSILTEGSFGAIPKTGPQGTPTSPGVPVPLTEPTKGPPNEATIMMGPSLASAEFLKRTGTLGGDIQEEVNKNAAVLPTMAKRVDLIAQALTQFQSGGFADIREGLAKFTQGLRNAGVPGISDNMVQQISNGSISSQQVFQSLISRAAVQTLKTDAAGTGRIMQVEVERYLGMMGDTNDPRSLTTLMNNLRFTLLVGYDQGQKLIDYKQALARNDPSVAGLDISDFPSLYNRNFDEAKMAVPKGISIGPIVPGAFKGSTPEGELPQGAKVWQKNSTTGKWE
jgi:uncharacterized protein YidB (DUF937 family)